MKKFSKMVYRTYAELYEFEAESLEQAEEIWNDFDAISEKCTDCDEEPAEEVTE